jgi:Immunoglobulin domain
LAITNQPLNQWVTPGVNVNFTVGAGGNPPFSYQWQKHGTNIAGATDSSLTLSNVTRAAAGSYAAVVTNAWGSLLSSNASLRVVTPQYLRVPVLESNDTVRILFGDSDGGSLSSNDMSNFEVRASSNLIDWETLTNTLALTNGFMFLEDSAGYPQRFYRILER